MKEFLISLILLNIFGCNFKNQDSFSSDPNVVKIIKTKAYTAIQDFDKIKIGKPVFDLGYDETIGKDFTWSIKYYDKYENILKEERINIDSNEVENTYSTTVYTYFNAQKKLLSSIKKIFKDGSNDETIYIRDKSGKLNIIVEKSGDLILNKTIFSYNKTNQLLKKEVYERKGLKVLYEYDYYKPLKDNSCNIKKEIMNDYNYDVREEKEYTWLENKISILNEKYFKNDKLISEKTTQYKKYIDNEAMVEITDGYEPPRVESNLDGTDVKTYIQKPFKKNISRTFNSNKDILTYSSSKSGKGIKSLKSLKPGETLVLTELSMRDGSLGEDNMYQLKYKYNKRNDWTELLLNANNNKYLVFREIQYLH